MLTRSSDPTTAWFYAAVRFKHALTPCHGRVPLQRFARYGHFWLCSDPSDQPDNSPFRICSDPIKSQVQFRRRAHYGFPPLCSDPTAGGRRPSLNLPELLIEEYPGTFLITASNTLLSNASKPHVISRGIIASFSLAFNLFSLHDISCHPNITRSYHHAKLF